MPSLHEKELFVRALEIEDPQERTSFLEEACEGDNALRARLEMLLGLESASEHDRFLESDASAIVEALAESAADQMPADPEEILGEFGDYDLLEVIARGAMGVVYKARQRSLNRIVAVKMIRSALLASEKEVQRFLNEAEAAAQLDHPNIVPIHEIGACEGEHFFSMKYVEGGTLTDQMERLRGDHRAAATLIAKVAHAVHAAHQRGIIHRDLKPANVLVDESGEPHVTDFGLAKQLEGDQGLTLSGQMMGTPYYMAPEQVHDGGKGLTTAADIYSLGAVLYEILAGRPPFKGDSVLDTLNRARDQTVPPIKNFERRVDRDLETIALRCLAKRPANRYSSAEALADDLDRRLRGEPITARPVTGLERVLKWIKRRPVYAGLWGSAAVLVLLLGIGGPVVAIQQKQLRDAAEASKSEALEATAQAERNAKANRRNLYVAEMNLAIQAESEDEGLNVLLDITNRWIPSEGEVDLRGWEWYFLRSLAQRDAGSIKGHDSMIRDIVFSPDGEKIAVCAEDGKVKIFDSGLTHELLAFAVPGQVPMSLAWSPDGERLIVGGRPDLVGIFSASNGELIADLTGVEHPVRAVAWCSDGNRIAVGSASGQVSVAEGSNWEVVSQTTAPEAGAVYEIAWRPGHQELAAATHRSGTLIWNAERTELLRTLAPELDVTKSLAWRPDGARVAFGGFDHLIWIFDGDTDEKLRELKGSINWIEDLAWSPDGRSLASAGDLVVRLWDTETGEQRQVLRGHRVRSRAVAWHPDGKALVSGDESGFLQRGEPAEMAQATTLIDSSEPIQHVVWSPDGRLLASAGWDGCLRVWDTESWLMVWEQVVSSEEGPTSVSWSANGSRLATGGWDGKAQIWNYATRSLETTIYDGFRVEEVLLTPGGDRALTCEARKVQGWDLVSGTELFELPLRGSRLVPSLCLSPSGQLFAIPLDAVVEVRNSLDGKLQHTIRLGSAINGFAWSPDEKRLAVATMTDIRLCDFEGDHSPRTLRGHAQGVLEVDWSPDGTRLASVGQDRTCRIWDVASGRQMLVLREHESSVWWVDWSPDGKKIATASLDGTMKIWDASKGYDEFGTAPVPVVPLLP